MPDPDELGRMPADTRMRSRAAIVVVILGCVALAGTWWFMHRDARDAHVPMHDVSKPSPVSELPGRTQTPGNSPETASAARGPVSSERDRPPSDPVSRDSSVYVAKRLPPPDTKACASDADCPPKQACLIDYASNANLCLPEECAEDSDCSRGRVCRVVNLPESREPLRRCIIAGARLAGEACSTWPNGPESACDEDLICSMGRCGQRCKREGPNTCPPASSCAQPGNSTEASCVPDCKKSGCAEGKTCVPFGDVMALCLGLANRDCRSPGQECPQGQRCGMTYSRDTVLFHCDRGCSPFDPSACSDREVCGSLAGASACLLRCDPRSANGCPEHFRCGYADETHKVFACRPTPPSVLSKSAPAAGAR